VTGPSFTSATSIIEPKEPVFTEPTLLAEVVEESLGFSGGRGPEEARALALAGVGDERELRDREDLTPYVPHAQVHLPVLITEDPQARDLLGEPVRLGLPVSPFDADEEQQARTYAGDLRAFDRDGGVLDALEYYAHGL